MIKKIFVIIFIVTILFLRVEKKDDPVYNEENQNSEIFSNRKLVL